MFNHKMIVIISICVLMFSSVSNSQIDCPQGGGQWNTKSCATNFGGTIGGSVNYQMRNVGGLDFQVKIDWNSLDNFSLIIADSTMKKILESEIVNEIGKSIALPVEFSVSIYYIRPCKANVKLALKLDQTIQAACCDEGVSISEEIHELQDGAENHYYYNISKEIICGYKCCTKTYNCRVLYDIIGNKWYSEVLNTSKSSVSPCSGDVSPGADCITGEPIPCDGSCD